MKKKTTTKTRTADDKKVGTALDDKQVAAVAGGWMYMDWGGGLYGIPNSWNDMYAPSSGWNGYYY